MLCIGCTGHPRSDLKVPRASFAAHVFNRLCKKTMKNIWSFVKSTSLLKYKCPKMGRLYLSAIGRKRNGALSLCMLIWKQLMLNVMKLAHQHRTPASFGAVFFFDQRTNSIVDEQFYRGEECIEKLIETLRGWLTKAYVEKQKYRFLNISKLEREQLMTDAATACCICGNNFADPRKVIYHCHLTGIYSASHIPNVI